MRVMSEEANIVKKQRSGAHPPYIQFGILSVLAGVAASVVSLVAGLSWKCGLCEKEVARSRSISRGSRKLSDHLREYHHIRPDGSDILPGDPN